MRRTTALPILALLAALTLPSLDSSGDYSAREVVGHIFETADADGSGSLSAAEYEAAHLFRFGVSFEDTDADGNGETTLDEYLTLFDQHHPSSETADI